MPDGNNPQTPPQNEKDIQRLRRAAGEVAASIAIPIPAVVQQIGQGFAEGKGITTATPQNPLMPGIADSAENRAAAATATAPLLQKDGFSKQEAARAKREKEIQQAAAKGSAALATGEIWKDPNPAYLKNLALNADAGTAYDLWQETKMDAAQKRQEARLYQDLKEGWLKDVAASLYPNGATPAQLSAVTSEYGRQFDDHQAAEKAAAQKQAEAEAAAIPDDVFKEVIGWGDLLQYAQPYTSQRKIKLSDWDGEEKVTVWKPMDDTKTIWSAGPMDISDMMLPDGSLNPKFKAEVVANMSGNLNRARAYAVGKVNKTINQYLSQPSRQDEMRERNDNQILGLVGAAGTAAARSLTDLGLMLGAGAGAGAVKLFGKGDFGSTFGSIYNKYHAKAGVLMPAFERSDVAQFDASEFTDDPLQQIKNLGYGAAQTVAEYAVPGMVTGGASRALTGFVGAGLKKAAQSTAAKAATGYAAKAVSKMGGTALAESAVGKATTRAAQALTKRVSAFEDALEGRMGFTLQEKAANYINNVAVSLRAGGAVTYGKYWDEAIAAGVGYDPQTGKVDYDQVADWATERVLYNAISEGVVSGFAKEKMNVGEAARELLKTPGSKSALKNALKVAGKEGLGGGVEEVAGAGMDARLNQSAANDEATGDMYREYLESQGFKKGERFDFRKAIAGAYNDFIIGAATQGLTAVASGKAWSPTPKDGQAMAALLEHPELANRTIERFEKYGSIKPEQAAWLKATADRMAPIYADNKAKGMDANLAARHAAMEVRKDIVAQNLESSLAQEARYADGSEQRPMDFIRRVVALVGPTTKEGVQPAADGSIAPRLYGDGEISAMTNADAMKMLTDYMQASAPGNLSGNPEATALKEEYEKQLAADKAWAAQTGASQTLKSAQQNAVELARILRAQRNLETGNDIYPRYISADKLPLAQVQGGTTALRPEQIAALPASGVYTLTPNTDAATLADDPRVQAELDKLRQAAPKPAITVATSVATAVGTEAQPATASAPVPAAVSLYDMRAALSGGRRDTKETHQSTVSDVQSQTAALVEELQKGVRDVPVIVSQDGKVIDGAYEAARAIHYGLPINVAQATDARTIAEKAMNKAPGAMGDSQSEAEALAEAERRNREAGIDHLADWLKDAHSEEAPKTNPAEQSENNTGDNTTTTPATDTEKKDSNPAGKKKEEKKPRNYAGTEAESEADREARLKAEQDALDADQQAFESVEEDIRGRLKAFVRYQVKSIRLGKNAAGKNVNIHYPAPITGKEAIAEAAARVARAYQLDEAEAAPLEAALRHVARQLEAALPQQVQQLRDRGTHMTPTQVSSTFTGDTGRSYTLTNAAALDPEMVAFAGRLVEYSADGNPMLGTESLKRLTSLVERAYSEVDGMDTPMARSIVEAAFAKLDPTRQAPGAKAGSSSKSSGKSKNEDTDSDGPVDADDGTGKPKTQAQMDKEEAERRKLQDLALSQNEAADRMRAYVLGMIEPDLGGNLKEGQSYTKMAASLLAAYKRVMKGATLADMEAFAEAVVAEERARRNENEKTRIEEAARARQQALESMPRPVRKAIARLIRYRPVTIVNTLGKKGGGVWIVWKPIVSTRAIDRLTARLVQLYPEYKLDPETARKAAEGAIARADLIAIRNAAKIKQGDTPQQAVPQGPNRYGPYGNIQAADMSEVPASVLEAARRLLRKTADGNVIAGMRERAILMDTLMGLYDADAAVTPAIAKAAVLHAIGEQNPFWNATRVKEEKDLNPISGRANAAEEAFDDNDDEPDYGDDNGTYEPVEDAPAQSDDDARQDEEADMAQQLAEQQEAAEIEAEAERAMSAEQDEVEAEQQEAGAELAAALDSQAAETEAEIEQADSQSDYEAQTRALEQQVLEEEAAKEEAEAAAKKAEQEALAAQEKKEAEAAAAKEQAAAQDRKAQLRNTTGAFVSPGIRSRWNDKAVGRIQRALVAVMGKVLGSNISVLVLSQADFDAYTQGHNIHPDTRGFVDAATAADGSLRYVVVLNGDNGKARPATMLHEVGHLWMRWAKSESTKMATRGLTLARESETFQMVSRMSDILSQNPEMTDANVMQLIGQQFPALLKGKGWGGMSAKERAYNWLEYARNHAAQKERMGEEAADNALAEEVLVHAIEEWSENGTADSKGLVEWIKKLWAKIADSLPSRNRPTPEKLSTMTLAEFAAQVGGELAEATGFNADTLQATNGDTDTNVSESHLADILTTDTHLAAASNPEVAPQLEEVLASIAITAVHQRLPVYVSFEAERLTRALFLNESVREAAIALIATRYKNAGGQATYANPKTRALMHTDQQTLRKAVRTLLADPKAHRELLEQVAGIARQGGYNPNPTTKDLNDFILDSVVGAGSDSYPPSHKFSAEDRAALGSPKPGNGFQDDSAFGNGLLGQLFGLYRQDAQEKENAKGGTATSTPKVVTVRAVMDRLKAERAERLAPAAKEAAKKAATDSKREKKLQGDNTATLSKDEKKAILSEYNQKAGGVKTKALRLWREGYQLAIYNISNDLTENGSEDGTGEAKGSTEEKAKQMTVRIGNVAQRYRAILDFLAGQDLVIAGKVEEEKEALDQYSRATADEYAQLAGVDRDVLYGVSYDESRGAEAEDNLAIDVAEEWQAEEAMGPQEVASELSADNDLYSATPLAAEEAAAAPDGDLPGNLFGELPTEVPAAIKQPQQTGDTNMLFIFEGLSPDEAAAKWRTFLPDAEDAEGVFAKKMRATTVALKALADGEHITAQQAAEMKRELSVLQVAHENNLRAYSIGRGVGKGDSVEKSTLQLWKGRAHNFARLFRAGGLGQNDNARAVHQETEEGRAYLQDIRHEARDFAARMAQDRAEWMKDNPNHYFTQNPDKLDMVFSAAMAGDNIVSPRHGTQPAMALLPPPLQLLATKARDYLRAHQLELLNSGLLTPDMELAFGINLQGDSARASRAFAAHLHKKWYQKPFSVSRKQLDDAVTKAIASGWHKDPDLQRADPTWGDLNQLIAKKKGDLKLLLALPNPTAQDLQDIQTKQAELAALAPRYDREARLAVQRVLEEALRPADTSLLTASESRIKVRQYAERKQLEPWYREFLGEITNPEDVLLLTMGKLATMKAQLRYLDNMRALGLQSGMVRTSEQHVPDGFRFVAAKVTETDPRTGLKAANVSDGERLSLAGSLAGHYIHPDLYEVLFARRESNPFYQAQIGIWRDINARINFGKIVLSPITLITNFLSNKTFLLANGTWTKLTTLLPYMNSIIEAGKNQYNANGESYLQGVIFDAREAGIYESRHADTIDALFRSIGENKVFREALEQQGIGLLAKVHTAWQAKNYGEVAKLLGQKYAVQGTSKVWDATMKGFAYLFQQGDIVPKLVAFEVTRNHIAQTLLPGNRQGFYGLTPQMRQNVQRMAADKVASTMPGITRQLPIARFISQKVPFLGQIGATFVAETYRIISHQINVLRGKTTLYNPAFHGELSANPAENAAMIKRLNRSDRTHAMLGIAAYSGAAQLLLQAVIGFAQPDDDDEQDSNTNLGFIPGLLDDPKAYWYNEMRERITGGETVRTAIESVLPHYSKSNPILYALSGNKLSVWDTKSTDPFAILGTIARGYIHHGMIGGTQEAAKNITEPFLGVNLLFKTIMDLAQNEHGYTGKDIVLGGDTGTEAFWKRFNYTLAQLGPGIVVSYSQMKRDMEGGETMADAAGAQLQKTFMGRRKVINLDDKMRQMATDVRKDWAGQAGYFKSEWRNADLANKDAIAAQALIKKEQLARALSDQIRHMRLLGRSDQDIRTAFKKAELPKDISRAVLKGDMKYLKAVDWEPEQDDTPQPSQP